MKTDLSSHADSLLLTPKRQSVIELRAAEDKLHAEWDIAFHLWLAAMDRKDVAAIRQAKHVYDQTRDIYLAAHSDTQDAIYAAEMHTESA